MDQLGSEVFNLKLALQEYEDRLAKLYQTQNRSKWKGPATLLVSSLFVSCAHTLYCNEVVMVGHGAVVMLRVARLVPKTKAWVLVGFVHLINVPSRGESMF